ncbi:histone-lysine n-methyltransferase ezh1 [Teratosphaeria destructans]|uniref:Histone-lysine n-methyltransferase ezh1 n=1 Tax=Teratosphaeria destructans TaxID=418781 RepID=A0A9W7SSH0_9PEZI|nr:histone-lysine n-methyltransferase ezh1 [Teratosphaeria destructans]
MEVNSGAEQLLTCVNQNMHNPPTNEHVQRSNNDDQLRTQALQLQQKARDSFATNVSSSDKDSYSTYEGDGQDWELLKMLWDQTRRLSRTDHEDVIRVLRPYFWLLRQAKTRSPMISDLFTAILKAANRDHLQGTLDLAIAQDASSDATMAASQTSKQIHQSRLSLLRHLGPDIVFYYRLHRKAEGLTNRLSGVVKQIRVTAKAQCHTNTKGDGDIIKQTSDLLIDALNSEMLWAVFGREISNRKRSADDPITWGMVDSLANSIDILPRLEWQRYGIKLEFDQHGLCTAFSGQPNYYGQTKIAVAREKWQNDRVIQDSVPKLGNRGKKTRAASASLETTTRQSKRTRKQQAPQDSGTEEQNEIMTRRHAPPRRPVQQDSGLSKAGEDIAISTEAAIATSRPQTAKSTAGRHNIRQSVADGPCQRVTDGPRQSVADSPRQSVADGVLAQDQTVLELVNGAVREGQSQSGPAKAKHDDPLSYRRIQYQALIQNFIEQCQEAKSATTVRREQKVLSSCIQWLGSDWAEGATKYEEVGDVLVVSAQAAYRGLGEEHWQPNRPLLIINSGFQDEHCLDVERYSQRLLQHFSNDKVEVSVQTPGEPAKRQKLRHAIRSIKECSGHLLEATNLLDLPNVSRLAVPTFLHLDRFQEMRTRMHQHQTMVQKGTLLEKQDVTTTLQDCEEFNIFGSKGSFSSPHVDLLNGTWIRIVDGVKAWPFAVGLSTQDYRDWVDFNAQRELQVDLQWYPQGKVKMIVLKKGDVFFMPPGVVVVHAPVTLETCVAQGGMLWDRERVPQIRDNIRWTTSFHLVTNEDPQDFETLLRDGCPRANHGGFEQAH